jgi:hypothetical protein
MDELFQELNINKKKYIIIYYQENDNNNLFLNKILKYEEFLEYKIILLYKNKKDSTFSNERIIELIYDDNVEKYFLEEPFTIFYITDDIPSSILINFLKKNEEIMFFYKENDNNIFFNNNEENIIIKDNNDFQDEYENDNDNDNESKNNNEEYEIDEEDSMNIYNNTDKNIFINKYESSDEKKSNQILNILMHKTKNENNNFIHNTDNSKLHIITFFKEFEDDEIMNSVQQKCIIENINNKDVKSICIVGKNLQKYFSNITISNKDIPNKDIILIEYGVTNISYSYLFNKVNELYDNKIVCILKSDIVIPNQDSLENIEFLFLEKKNTILALSRFERMCNGNIVKTQELNSIFYATEHDAYIFKTPVISIDFNLMDDLYFYNQYSNLEVNNILIKNNYKLLNDTKNYRILRLCIDNDIGIRKLINNRDIKEVNKDNIYLLPENMMFDNFNLQHLAMVLKMDDEEINEIKIYMLSVLFRKKNYKKE